MRRQKQKYDAGEGSSLTELKISQLDEAGFCWGTYKGEKLWTQRYTELKKFYEEFGHCRVPTKKRYCPPQYASLCRWISSQRAEHKLWCNNKPNSLTSEKIKLMDQIGFRWSIGPCKK